MSKQTVIIGMSGGVDSSVAAALLIEQGYDVVGLFMHNWEEEEGGECTAAADFADAVAVCQRLKIPCYSVNFSAQYLENVFAHFLSEYKKGRTPNPDVLCNREIKFGYFKDYAKKMGADLIATGHYCNVCQQKTAQNRAESAVSIAQPPENHLIKALDQNKDQTYFLNQVTSDQLQNVIFPVGNLNKTEVRAIAQKYGLPTAEKKDSTGICFIGERKFKEFLSRYLPAQSGQIRDLSGKILGEHSGLMYYTLGQRRGLGIGGVSGENQDRWYVVKKDLTTNTLVVSCGEGEELLSSGLVTEDFNWIGSPPSGTKFDCAAKFRYRQSEQPVTVTLLDKGVRIDFHIPQRAVTPGQYAVLYMGERCLGGGVITND